mmetsp:Transcript_14232/g.31837  ORF Transcript_14232/g.31837 Transcript_14232/m.31837 type:complete len:286 (-) Transcript_14232:1396-2253(-)
MRNPAVASTTSSMRPNRTRSISFHTATTSSSMIVSEHAVTCLATMVRWLSTFELIFERSSSFTSFPTSEFLLRCASPSSDSPVSPSSSRASLRCFSARLAWLSAESQKCAYDWCSDVDVGYFSRRMLYSRFAQLNALSFVSRTSRSSRRRTSGWVVEWRLLRASFQKFRIDDRHFLWAVRALSIPTSNSSRLSAETWPRAPILEDPAASWVDFRSTTCNVYWWSVGRDRRLRRICLSNAVASSHRRLTKRRSSRLSIMTLSLSGHSSIALVMTNSRKSIFSGSRL